MICEEKLRLLREYDTATKGLSTAVTKLSSQIGTSPKAEYEKLRVASDERRIGAERARQKLNRHVENHGC
jgi:hypothetical protein